MVNKVVVSTDCVCDLPQSLVDKYGIPIMYYYMQVGDARFQDINEINSDSILEYLTQEDKEISTACASVEEYVEFFRKVSQDGKKTVIHISIAENVSDGYGNAKEAAKEFENIYVVDSGKVSGAMGMIVLVAADLAQKGATKDIILQRLNAVRDKINCSFIMCASQCGEYNRKLNKALIGCLETLTLYPIITMKNSNFSLAGLCLGNSYRRAVRYIGKRLRNKEKISNEVLFIVMAGCDYDLRQKIIEEAKKQLDWKHIYVLRTSATISCNCGSGTFGMAYFNK